MRLIALFWTLILVCYPAQSFASTIALKIAVLPAEESIVIRIAEEQGFFEQNGLSVQIIPFQSALEIGSAMRAGSVDGQFADIINVLIQNETGAPQTIIFGTNHSAREQRHFGLVVGPNSKRRTLADLQNVKIAISSSTVIEIMLMEALKQVDLNQEYLDIVDIKSIPIRLQMLLSGQIEGAMLPEPLVSLVEAKGGYTILDDVNISASISVISLSNDLLQGETGEKLAGDFTQALMQACEYINANPDKVREKMIETGLLSPEAKEKYDVLRFDMQKKDENKPTLMIFETYVQWMLEQEMLDKVPSYSEIIF